MESRKEIWFFAFCFTSMWSWQALFTRCQNLLKNVLVRLNFDKPFKSEHGKISATHVTSATLLTHFVSDKRGRLFSCNVDNMCSYQRKLENLVKKSKKKISPHTHHPPCPSSPPSTSSPSCPSCLHLVLRVSFLSFPLYPPFSTFYSFLQQFDFLWYANLMANMWLFDA